MVLLGGLLLAPGLMGLVGALRIEATTPDAFCPAPQVLEQVVRDRLGELEDNLTLRYTVTRNIARGETTLQIVLLGSNGEVAFERKVPLGPDGCDGAALLIAHILEAHWLEREGAPSHPSTTTDARAADLTVPAASAPPIHPETPQSGALSGEPSPQKSRVSEDTRIGASHGTDQRTRHPSPTLDAHSLRPQPSLGVGVGFVFQGGSALTLHGHIPTGDDRWSLHFSLVAPLVPTNTVDTTLGLEIQSVNPGGSAELSYRVLHKHATSVYLGVGFIGFAQVAWIDDHPEAGIRSSGPEARFLGAPTVGLAVEYVLVRNWEVTFALTGGPTPVSTVAFGFAPGQDLPPGQEAVSVLSPSPIIGLGALAFHRRF